MRTNKQIIRDYNFLVKERKLLRSTTERIYGRKEVLELMEWARNEESKRANKKQTSFKDIIKALFIQSVSVSLPTKDEVVSEGYRIANDAGYNYRRVLKDIDNDIYYSGWMDCFDWISKGNEL